MIEPIVHIGIMEKKEISFELHGSYSATGYKKDFKGFYNAICEFGTIDLTDGDQVYPVNGEITFSPIDFNNSYFLLKNVTIGISFHWERKEDQRFQGSLKLVTNNDKIIAINILPVEHYLLSVISSEMRATSSMELLKAHSVISRSWLMAQIEKSKELKSSSTKYQSETRTDEELIKWYDREDHTLFHVCADDHCQRYQGITKAHTKTVHDAITQTHGLVLAYNNKICDTRFSKSCGGISETFENVWEPVKHPYLTKVVDYKSEIKNYDLDLTKEKAADQWIRTSPPAFCNTADKRILSQVLLDYDRETSDFYRWRIEYTQVEIAEIIRNKSGTDFGKIVDLVPLSRGVSGRIIKLKIVGTKKIFIMGKELEIRKILSPTHLYSSAFVVDRKNVANGIPQKFILTGAGWGHGVGLCQIGAAVMGDKGYNFGDILLHYFKGAQIDKYY